MSTTAADLATVEKPEQIVPLERDAAGAIVWDPKMLATVEHSRKRVEVKRAYYLAVMKEGLHYGKVPGSAKPVLLKAGAELLISDHALTPVLSDAEPPTLDFMGEAHGGEPFIRYRRACALTARISGELIVKAEGVCNSWEKKYRYRNDQRHCPNCGQTAIIKGKEEFGGGWLCWGKKDGCGTKFYDGDPAIEDQVVGKVLNPDIPDLENTVLKMSDKRAFIASVLLATGCSEIFTQDLEDDPSLGNGKSDVKPTGGNGNGSAKKTGQPANGAAQVQSDELRVILTRMADNFNEYSIGREFVPIIKGITRGRTGDYRQLNMEEANIVRRRMDERIDQIESMRHAAADPADFSDETY